MNVRWWRVALIYEENGAPHTHTFHARALTEKRARALVAERMQRDDFFVYGCHPSDPLPTAPPDEVIVADWGPYERSWDDPAVAALRSTLYALRRESGVERKA